MRNYSWLVAVVAAACFILSGCQSESTTNDSPEGKVEEPKQDSKDGKGTKDKEEPENKEEPEDKEPAKENVILQNNAFQVIAPFPNQKIGETFVVEGKARVFEASFQYRLEDGHNVLAEGHVMADEGAPAWGDFKFEIHYKGATSPNATLILFEASPNDGSPQHELVIPLQIENYQ